MGQNGDGVKLLPKHRLQLNDVTRTWVETRGSGREVYVAICDCGHRLEGTDGGDVARLFAQHTDNESS